MQHTFFQTSRKYKFLLLLVLLISISLRIGLVAVNREANDNHFEVSALILQTGKLPVMTDCHECFQPKLYHVVVAEIVRLFSHATSAQVDTIVLTGQWLNFSAGIFTLILIGLFISSLQVKGELLKILAFGLVALNPKLIGINSQATNDSFAILFSTAALFFALLFLQNKKLFPLILTLLFTVLGISSKMNVLVTAIAIPIGFFFKSWIDKTQWKKWAIAGALFIVSTLVLSIANPLNQYITNLQTFNSVFLVPSPKEPFPRLFGRTVAANPGILSISDGLFTFRFTDLLWRPVIIPGHDFTSSRTSLWTQIYGRAHSVHFDIWPSTWAAQGASYYDVSRLLYIFALPPSILLIFGFLLETLIFFKRIFSRSNEGTNQDYHGLIPVVFIGYLLFIINYVLIYRDYSFMKAIFIYPAILTFPSFFIHASNYLKEKNLRQVSWTQQVFTGWIVLLFILYIIDIITMIQMIYMRTFAL